MFLSNLLPYGQSSVVFRECKIYSFQLSYYGKSNYQVFKKVVLVRILCVSFLVKNNRNWDDQKEDN